MNKSLLKLAEQFEKSFEGEKLEEKLEDEDDFIDPTEGNIPPLISSSPPSSSTGIPTSNFWSRLKEDLNKQTTGVSQFQKTCSLVDAFEKVAIFGEMEEERDPADQSLMFPGIPEPPMPPDDYESINTEVGDEPDYNNQVQIIDDIRNGIESLTGKKPSVDDTLEFIHNITQAQSEEKDFQEEFEEEFEGETELPEDVLASLSYQFMTKIAADMEAPMSDDVEEQVKNKLEQLILEALKNVDLGELIEESLHGEKIPDAAYPLAQDTEADISSPETATIASVAAKYMKIAEEGFDPLARTLVDPTLPPEDATDMMDQEEIVTPSKEPAINPNPTNPGIKPETPSLLESIDVFDKKTSQPDESFEDEDEDEDEEDKE